MAKYLASGLHKPFCFLWCHLLLAPTQSLLALRQKNIPSLRKGQLSSVTKHTRKQKWHWDARIGKIIISKRHQQQHPIYTWAMNPNKSTMCHCWAHLPETQLLKLSRFSRVRAAILRATFCWFANVHRQMPMHGRYIPVRKMFLDHGSYFSAFLYIAQKKNTLTTVSPPVLSQRCVFF